jgi:hypothetical protein
VTTLTGSAEVLVGPATRVDRHLEAPGLGGELGVLRREEPVLEAGQAQPGWIIGDPEVELTYPAGFRVESEDTQVATAPSDLEQGDGADSGKQQDRIPGARAIPLSGVGLRHQSKRGTGGRIPAFAVHDTDRHPAHPALCGICVRINLSGSGMDDDPDGVDVLVGFVEVFVGGRGVERDRVAGA